MTDGRIGAGGPGTAIDGRAGHPRHRRNKPLRGNPDCPRRGFLLHKRMAASSSPTPPHPAEPPLVPEPLARAHARYWRFNVALIAVLSATGALVSFIVPFFATALAHLRFAGFSLPFYLGAQGAILVYVALIVVYIVLMQRADKTLRHAYDAYAARQERDAAAPTDPGPC